MEVEMGNDVLNPWLDHAAYMQKAAEWAKSIDPQVLRDLHKNSETFIETNMNATYSPLSWVVEVDEQLAKAIANMEPTATIMPGMFDD
jgi:hypothetical protein